MTESDTAGWRFVVREDKEGRWRMYAFTPDGEELRVHGPTAKTREAAEEMLTRAEPRLRRLFGRLHGESE